jgi:transcriptional regulator with XRE-family HTH domain
MTVIARWTGREARMLRQSMRLTVRDFAESLGVNPRTVSRWESAGDPHTPGPELQQVLDTVLDRATDGDRQRFLSATHVNPQDDEERVGTDSQEFSEALARSIIAHLNSTDAPDGRHFEADVEAPVVDGMASRMVLSGRSNRLPPEELTRLAGLAGNVVDLSRRVDLDIRTDGSCVATYRFNLLNLTDRPLSRVARGLWFERSLEDIHVEPLDEDYGVMSIKSLHSAKNLIKFACLLSPPVQPGASLRFGYRGLGGEFQNEYYWRQSIVRPTRRSTLRVRHQGLGCPRRVTAVHELADGSEVDVSSSVVQENSREDVVLTFMVDNLLPDQHATLRWEA